MTLKIDPYRPSDRESIIDLSLNAWGPVFEKLQPAAPAYVYQAFYPSGWQFRQTADIGDFLEQEGERVLVARAAGTIVGVDRNPPSLKRQHGGDLYPRS